MDFKIKCINFPFHAVAVKTIVGSDAEASFVVAEDSGEESDADSDEETRYFVSDEARKGE